MSLEMKKKQRNYLKYFHIYDFLMEKLKHLPSIELLHELSFHDELSVVEISKAF